MSGIGREVLGEDPESIEFGWIDVEEFLNQATVTDSDPGLDMLLMMMAQHYQRGRPHSHHPFRQRDIRDFQQTPLTEIYSIEVEEARGNIRIFKSERYDATLPTRINIGFSELLGMARYRQGRGVGAVITTGSPERAYSAMQFWKSFDPDFENIREFRFSLSVDRAESLFDFGRIRQLVHDGDISMRSENVEQLNQPLSQLEPAIRDYDELEDELRNRVESMGVDLESVWDKVRIRWGHHLGRHPSIEIYQTQTLLPVIPALVENLVRSDPMNPPDWYHVGEYSLLGGEAGVDMDLAALLPLDHLDEAAQSVDFLEGGSLTLDRNSIEIIQQNSSYRINRYLPVTLPVIYGLNRHRRSYFGYSNVMDYISQLVLYSEVRGIDYVLNGVTLQLDPSERIAVLGRTGFRSDSNTWRLLDKIAAEYLSLYVPNDIASAIDESVPVKIGQPDMNSEIREAALVLRGVYPRLFNRISTLVSAMPDLDHEVVDETAQLIRTETKEKQHKLSEYIVEEPEQIEYIEEAYDEWGLIQNVFSSEDESQRRSRRKRGFHFDEIESIGVLINKISEIFFN